MDFEVVVRRFTGAKTATPIQKVQSLWSGYGQIVRYALEGAAVKTVIVKHINTSGSKGHPRDWNTDISHQRKLKSYQVETNWYQQWSERCDEFCRVAKCLGVDVQENKILLVLEDLDAAGFAQRKDFLQVIELKACLTWLAHFHARFLNEKPTGLWPTGTYWHLDTRPDELDALQDRGLKRVAADIDKILKDCHFQTIVHGDAKVANFCFSKDGSAVAAVDFQYAGGGCGMKDVAYFIGSCLNEEECQKHEAEILDFYFSALRDALRQKQADIDANALEREWRLMFPFAWTDFHRFLKGWSPDHWKINSYSERMARRVMAQLTEGRSIDAVESE